MRSILVFLLVVLAGPLVYAVAMRAQHSVATSAGGAAETPAANTADVITQVRLEVYAVGVPTPVRVVTCSPTGVDLGDDGHESCTPALFATVAQAADAARSQLNDLGRHPGAPAAGGDVLVIERGTFPPIYLSTRGWGASPVDAVKQALWGVIRARWTPARKRQPSTEFVEPFQTIRTQLRIRF